MPVRKFKFSNMIFWCEFPNRVNWKKFKALIKFKTEVWVACPSRKQFTKLQRKIKNKNIQVGVWPTLPRREGYWFSGFCSKKSIDKLKQFAGLKIKIDVEPPIPKSATTFQIIKYILKYFIIFRAKNNQYLTSTIKTLEKKKSELIISGFPLPCFMLKKYGDEFLTLRISKTKKNFFVYTSLLPTLFKYPIKKYYTWFIKRKLKQHRNKVMFAVGCTGSGIHGNEPSYKNIEEFKKDFDLLANLKVKNVVIFNVSGIMQRQNPKEWLDLIKSYKA